ncbi:MAG: hypothetical protein ACI9XO_004729 [Paraglaciecola sp.]
MKYFIIIWFSILGISSISFAQTTQKAKPVELEFIPQGGFYDKDIAVELFLPNAKIYYTTDGSKPRPSASRRYKKPIFLDSTAVIRAIAFIDGKTTNAFSHTYFRNEPESTIPVISLSIEASALFDLEHGLFMKGNNAVDSLWRKPGANFWSRRETSLNVEIFEPDGNCVYRSLSGMRVFGGMSRLFPQKSIAIVARKRYGKKRIKHKFYGKGHLKKFKYLVLRNSGSDFGKTHFRDALMTSLVEDWDLEKQDYQPAHTYINGKYWGIYNIREKVNRYFVAGKQEVHKDSIDLLEHHGIRKRGSKKHYTRLLRFLKKNDLTDAANYTWIGSQMEIDNFIDFQIAQIYFDNQDAGGNIKYWRPQTPEGKWRWILYDTDYGFGLHQKNAFKNNSLAFHTNPDGPFWPNPSWSTLILRKLLTNEEFQHQFLNRFADRLNTSFESMTVLQKIEEFYLTLKPEMKRHHQRWRLRRTTWENEVKVLQQFAENRPEYVWTHLNDQFQPGDLKGLKLEISHGGHIILNKNLRIDGGFVGQYFQNIPIKLEAVPHLGYRFSHWEGIEINGEAKELTLQLNSNKQLFRAVFEKYEHPLADRVIINEISCNNQETGDWVEIYNYTDEKVNLNGWMFTDTKNEFYFPNVNLNAQDYLILCEDSVAFKKAFPKAYNLVGSLGFGLNKRHETLKLFAPGGAGVDSIAYAIEPMDSIFTLNLLLPWFDNGDSENWEVLRGFGTPNSANAYYVQSTLQARRDLWMQMGLAAAVAIICIMLLVLRSRKMI